MKWSILFATVCTIVFSFAAQNKAEAYPRGHYGPHYYHYGYRRPYGRVYVAPRPAGVVRPGYYPPYRRPYYYPRPYAYGYRRGGYYRHRW